MPVSRVAKSDRTEIHDAAHALIIAITREASMASNGDPDRLLLNIFSLTTQAIGVICNFTTKTTADSLREIMTEVRRGEE